MFKQKKSPPIYRIERIDFPTPKILTLANGMEVYLLEGGSQDVCKVDFMFEAGRPYEHKRLTAATLAGIIKEGTLKHTASEIAEAIDHCGASISSPFSFDHIHLQLVCLSKHLPRLLPLIVEIIREPSFEEAELDLFKKRTVRRLAVDLSNNDVVAYRKATELYFGADHPYGYNSNEQAYLEVSRDDLVLHHRKFFGPGHGKVFIAGRWPDDLEKSLDSLLSDWCHKSEPLQPQLPPIRLARRQVEGDMRKPQSAIRIGRSLFNRNHEDWPVLFLLNTMLGGYFGSRLMKNLREAQGLTYGVQSAVESLRFGGYLSVNLETEKRHVKKALKGIYHEIENLQNELVSEHELQMVKNYSGGYLLSLMDGPLQILDVLKNNLAEDSPVDFTSKLLQKLAHISREQVRSCAQRYLQKEDLCEVVIH